MGALVSFLIAMPIGAGVVLFVKRILEGHKYSEEERRRLMREGPTGATFPTLTTEGTSREPRDPGFELDANAVRQKQG